MGDRFVFVGNRRFVLEQMLLESLNICAVFVVKGTHLERDLKNGSLPQLSNPILIQSKPELINLLKQVKFDNLISNGCPYVLPVSDLPRARYVNIHPSFLPDLRGADPVIGAILFERAAGATCHIMDAGIDTGPVISQVRIPYTEDLDATTLYQLSFLSEKQVFSQSLARNFQPAFDQGQTTGQIYYTRNQGDRTITFKEPNDFILRKIKAFNNKSQGCEFTVRNTKFRVFAARYMHNSFLAGILDKVPALTVALSYENNIIFRKDGQIIRFESIESAGGHEISVGDLLL